MSNSGYMVSVVVPAYNNEKTIERCLQSILKQTYTNLEIIVVDDASTDDTVCIVKSMEDERIHCIESYHAGVSHARNVGITHTNGEYLIFVDADDEIRCDLIALALDIANEADVVLWGFCIKRPDASTIKVWDESEECSTFDIGDLPRLYWDIYLHSPCNKLYRTEIIKRNHIVFDEELSNGEDLEFNLKYFEWIKGFKGSFINQPLYTYYVGVNENSLSSKQRFNEAYKIAERLIDFFENNVDCNKGELWKVYALAYKSMLYCVDKESSDGNYQNKSACWINRKKYFADLFELLDTFGDLPVKYKFELWLLKHDFYVIDQKLRNFKISFKDKNLLGKCLNV